MIRQEWAGPAVATIRLDRPERRNALSTSACQDLARAVQEVDRAGARVVLISGEGPAFCAGADLDTVRDDEFRGAL
ncbi:MAG: enoyl-CoA hydratase-related protein, partial [Acidimicrobiales bacterium]